MLSCCLRFGVVSVAVCTCTRYKLIDTDLSGLVSSFLAGFFGSLGLGSWLLNYKVVMLILVLVAAATERRFLFLFLRFLSRSLALVRLAPFRNEEIVEQKPWQQRDLENYHNLYLYISNVGI